MLGKVFFESLSRLIGKEKASEVLLQTAIEKEKIKQERKFDSETTELEKNKPDLH